MQEAKEKEYKDNKILITDVDYNVPNSGKGHEGEQGWDLSDQISLKYPRVSSSRSEYME